MEKLPNIKTVYARGVAVGEIESIGDHLADAKAGYEILKNKGLIQECSQAAVMFRQAVAFCTVASNLYSECRHSPERLGTVGVPLVVNMSFSIELYLKTLAQVHGQALKGHDLVKLFEKLPRAARVAIDKATPNSLIKHGLNPELGFDQILIKIRTSFIDWRYSYENKVDGDVFPIIETFAVGFVLHTLCVDSGTV